MTSSRPSFRCVLMGEQSLLIRCGTLLLDRGHEIAGVVANDDQIRQWATDEGLSRWSPTDDYAAQLRDVDFDYFFSVANLRIVPAAVLKQARRDAINFHDGPLPERAGLYVPAWSIIEQHDAHGVTWHRMETEVDAGDILVDRRFPIAADETVFTLNTKCYEAGVASFEELIQGLEADTLSPRPQDLSEQTYYPPDKRPAHAGILDWSASAASLDALVRGLDFEIALNPLTTPKLYLGSALYRIGALEVLPEQATASPGSIMELTSDRMVVASGTHHVALSALTTLQGEAVTLTDACDAHNLSVGDRLPPLDADAATRLADLQSTLSTKESFWRSQLRRRTALDLPAVSAPRDAMEERRASQPALPLLLDNAPAAVNTAIAVAGFLARLTQSSSLSLDLQPSSLPTRIAGFESLYAARVPWTVDVDLKAPATDALEGLHDAWTTIMDRGTYAKDLPARTPYLGADATRPSSVEILLLDDNAGLKPLAEGVALSLQVHPDGALTWHYDAARIADDLLDQMRAQLACFVKAVAEQPTQSLCTVPVLAEAELQTLLTTWNDTERPYDPTPIHEQFAAQVERTPDASALVFGGTTWTYRTLDERATRIAHRLIALGVEPGDRVGVCVERSLDMVAALFAIWKAGAAYVPLDPEYPSDRVAFMVADADLACVVSQTRFAHLLASTDSPLLFLDDTSTPLADLPTSPVGVASTPDDIAYVIYTSGSTGTPKGVMVTHRNVANFFAGMDDRIPRHGDGQDVWLAVTSISFDISVLELFWTLTRGFTVVLHTSDRTRVAEAASSAPGQTSTRPSLDRPIDFSLFYFSSDEKLDDSAAAGASDKYRLLLEGAEFGDQNGFEAVWTPERHFHDFGGLYPNPSVISAAIAARTSKIGIRAGSCVSPLHHPVRIAEDWSIVDNLSDGRVGISFAAGWQPNDFVIQPQNFADRKALMFDQIEQVKALWRGEEQTYDGPTGPVTLRTLPRPVQPELPVWVTAAGNPDTFEQAGAGGYHLLTHLLGQSVEDLTEKIAVYRRAWTHAGHPGTGTVTLMLHTFVGEDADTVRDTVREPMKDYLRSSIALIKEAAWAFPTFKQKTTDDDGMFSLDGLTDEEVDAVLDHAFERYYATSGLFGTPAQCLERVSEVAAAGVNEIACLLDFGIDAETVLAHLPQLSELKTRADQLALDAANVSASGDGRPGAEPVLQDDSLPAQLRRHAVTHLQCTPSQARMLVADAETRSALNALDHLMVGGEAFPPALARELTALVGGTVTNMYGPTETTIWSATAPVPEGAETVSIGTPIANTTTYVLDAARQPVPIGHPGELWIGGEGVTAGYLGREALTAERFVENPFHDGRMYRTGDLVRHAPDGSLDFLGRTDFQVKIRGHRIELGEIEAALDRQPHVRAAVAHVHTTDDGDQRLVAYLQPEANAPTLDPEALRSALSKQLPQIMVPALYVLVDRFPLTPNGKVDRSALPTPVPPRTQPTPVVEAAAGSTEALVGAIWQKALGVDQIGVTDNFFDLGGHSLMAVQIVRRLSEELDREVPIVDLFQYPTIRSLSDHLGTEVTPTEGASRGASRAERRRQAFARR